jgi:hypothetical protein
LSVLTVAGLALELAFERHWHGFVQWLPWLFLGIVAASLVLIALSRSTSVVVAARALALAAVVGSGIGVFKHIEANYNVGGLDFRYADTWDEMSEAERWWKAATKEVGPSPILAPAAIAMAGALALAATMPDRGR